MKKTSTPKKATPQSQLPNNAPVNTNNNELSFPFTEENASGSKIKIQQNSGEIVEGEIFSFDPALGFLAICL